MSKKFSVSLTTAIKPAALFLVDGQEYEMLGPEHLSPEEDAEVMALFARHALLLSELEMTRNLQKGTAVAEAVRKGRFAIIGKLTNMPRDLIERLPLPQQAKLMEAIRAEMEFGMGDEEDDLEEKGTETPPEDDTLL